jgi:hypothetical protein
LDHEREKGYFCTNGFIKMRIRTAHSNAFLLSILLIFWLNENKAQNSGKSPIKKDTLYQNKIGGVYGTDFLVTASVSYYGQSISFKYNSDSFYYWKTPNINGKGVYQIKDDKLYLNFENTKLRSKLESEYRLSTTNTDGQHNRISVNSFYITDTTKPTYATIKIISASGKELLNAQRVKQFSPDVSDYPITITGFLLQCYPIKFTLSSPDNYDIRLLFQPEGDEVICNGETWTFDIRIVSHDLIQLHRLDDFEENSKRIFKTFVFTSYRRM